MTISCFEFRTSDYTDLEHSIFKSPTDDEVWELIMNSKEEIPQLYYFNAWPDKKNKNITFSDYKYWKPIGNSLYDLGKLLNFPKKDLNFLKDRNFWGQLEIYFVVNIDSPLISSIINMWGYYTKLDRNMFIPPLSHGANKEFPSLINFFENYDSQYGIIYFLGDGGEMYILVHEEHENKIVEKFEGGIIK